MTRRLPPLNQLRVFEAAARHGSFKLAAEELHVTQTAVSHQIKALEDLLGRTLFHRVTRGVRPTAEAGAYQQALSRALDIVEEATEALRSEMVTGPLAVSVAPSFGTRWLLPRLGGFAESHPEIDLKPQITQEMVDFSTGTIDAAIRHGRGGWRDMSERLLFAEELLPVAAPGILPEGASPELLAHGPRLLGATPRHDEWPLWFKKMGVEVQEPPAVLEFPTLALALDAAVSRQGVALVDRRLVAADLSSGRLVAGPGPAMRQGRGLYLVHPRRDTADRRVAAFHDWLLSELEVSDEASNGMAGH